jgi:ATP-dependent RNA helicase RhlE
MTFETLGLSPELLRAVAAEGYTEPTPVQAEAIPHVLARRDVLAGAQTGTGKTAAFVLPILQLLNATRPPARHPIGPRPRGATGLPIRCLVLTPTRELALQVEEFVRTYGKEQPIRSTTVYGGVGYDAQIKAVQGGPEIVVATPGRLLDISEQGKIDLRSVEILVLDEADRMLDMGFIRDIRKIIALLPPRRQNLMFSATFADDVRQLADTILNNPAQIQIARQNAPIELVRQVIHPVDRHRKRELLSWLIRSGRIDRALVFARTKHGASRLADQLERDGISAGAIHGDRTQGQRIKALDDFKEGRIDILVATEVAARGLDIDGLPHVVNFELPTVPADYVHRIGRTGRAGMEGDAVSLVCIDELDLLHDIERLVNYAIPREFLPGFEPDASIRAEPIREVRGGNRGVVARGAPRRRSTREGAISRPDARHAGGRRLEGRPTGRSGSTGHAPAHQGAARPAGRPVAGGRDASARPTHQPRPYDRARVSGPGSFVAMPGERFARGDAPG